MFKEICCEFANMCNKHRVKYFIDNRSTSKSHFYFIKISQPCYKKHADGNTVSGVFFHFFP